MPDDVCCNYARRCGVSLTNVLEEGVTQNGYLNICPEKVLLVPGWTLKASLWGGWGWGLLNHAGAGGP